MLRFDVAFNTISLILFMTTSHNKYQNNIIWIYYYFVMDFFWIEYEFNMIKGEVNCVCIEIEPVNGSSTNLVRVKTTNELTVSQFN